MQIVTAAQWPEEPGTVGLFGRDGALLHGRGEAAYAFGHAHTPDSELWLRWHRAGHLVGEELRVGEAVGAAQLDLPPMSLAQRYRTHRARARQCRRGMAAARRAQVS